MNKKNDYHNEEKRSQEKALHSIIQELKKCDTYSRASKYYNKSIKSRKIRDIMKTMGLIKINGFSEIQLLNKEKKKEIMPFSIKKVKDFLRNEEKQERKKEIIKKEKFNNTIIKKIQKMTELNIQHYKNKHIYLSPDIGTYNPNYDSIYKKTKTAIITENNTDKKENNIKKNNRESNIIKSLSYYNINNNNSEHFLTIQTKSRKKNLILTDRKEKNENKKIFSYNYKFKSKYPLINNNNDFIKFNTLTTNHNSSSSLKKNIKKKNKRDILNKNNNSISFNKDKNKVNFYHNTNSPKKLLEINNSDIFNKTKTYNDSYLKINNKIKNNRNNNIINANKKHLSHKTIFIKPTIPSIGYYEPKYDFIKSSLPKISFLYHNNNNYNKNNFAYKKNLLRKTILKYNMFTDYQVITDLNKNK